MVSITVVVSYANRDITIVMSDTRLNWYIDGKHFYDDENSKLVNLSEMGWASGAGLADFLDSFKKELSENTVTSVEDISKIYVKVLEDEKIKSPHVASDISKSAVIATWVAVEDGEVFLRLGLLEEDNFGHEVMLLEFGKYFILYPGEYLEDTEKAYKIQDKYLHVEVEETFEETLQRLFNIFMDISKDSNQCSTHCDIGIQFLQSTGVYKIKISGEVEELIKDLDEGILDKRYELIQAMKFEV